MSRTVDKEQAKLMIEFLDRVENIRQQLEDFDRELSDNIRPLALFFEGFDMDGKGTFEEK